MCKYKICEWRCGIKAFFCVCVYIARVNTSIPVHIVRVETIVSDIVVNIMFELEFNNQIHLVSIPG